MTIPAPNFVATVPDLTEYQGVDAFTGGQGLEWASEAEAEAGVETAKMMSPATTKAEIQALVGTPASIDDSGVELTSTWSSSKISGILGDIDAALDLINGETV